MNAKILLSTFVALLTVCSVNAQGPVNEVSQDTLMNGDPRFVIPDEIPSFPGGQKKLERFIRKNLRYPQGAEFRNVSGRVFVSFWVDVDGSLTVDRCNGSKDPSLRKEAVRLIGKMPKWEPATLDGAPVKVLVTLPINFILPPRPDFQDNEFQRPPYLFRN